MDIRAADEEDRDRARRALMCDRYALRERAQSEFSRHFGQNAAVEDVVRALHRHLDSGGEMGVEEHEPTSTARTDRIFRVLFQCRGRVVFSHFYLLPHDSIANCSIVFESLHPSN